MLYCDGATLKLTLEIGKVYPSEALKAIEASTRKFKRLFPFFSKAFDKRLLIVISPVIREPFRNWITSSNARSVHMSTFQKEFHGSIVLVRDVIS